ncbi:MAG: efflux RND transporter periplasmic adaptor subunit [Pirellulales bacterium]
MSISIQAYVNSRTLSRLFLLASMAGVTWLLMMFAGVFHPKVQTAADSRRRELPPNAELLTIQVITQPRFESAVGAIRPVHEAGVASKILARVLEVNVVAGKTVRAGEVLVRLSDEEQQSRVRQAEADRDLRKAEFMLAKADLDRATQLVRSQAISQAEYDAARTKLQTTEASLNRAGRAVEEAKVYLDYTTVTAPFSGTVVDKTVQPGDTVSPGQTLLTLYDPHQMQLVANVRESLAMKLRVGQQLPAELETLGLKCLATVSEVVPKADTSSRSFEVKVTGPCPDGVYSGMFGRLLLPLDDEQLLLVPNLAVGRVGQLTFVNVAKNGLMSRRSVQVGRVFKDQVEILSGLQAGEQIVLPSTIRPSTEGAVQ